MSELLFTDCGLDRAHHLRRDAQILDSMLHSPDRLIAAQWRELMLLHADGAAACSGTQAALLIDLAKQIVFLGLIDNRPVFAADVSDMQCPDGAEDPGWDHGGRWINLRNAAASLSGRDAGLLGCARALLNWHRTQQFCGRCGGPTESREGGHVRTCLDQTCNAQHYPRTDCAVIMLVEDGEHILLHRQPAWTPGMWSILAGFVEPGETLEQAVAREVFEETAIRVDQVRYAGSQPWPFPASLMVGFTARAVGGELKPDPHELDDARWFTRADIARDFRDVHQHDGSGRPFLARPGSIARMMINAWLAAEPKD